jgi:hypothetical protein
METTIKSELQGFVDGFGLGISKEKLADKAYWYMTGNGHECHTINGIYLSVDGEEFQFIKSCKETRWIIKEL